MADESKDDHEIKVEVSSEAIQQAIEQNDAKNLKYGCIGILIIIVIMAIGLWSCTSCASHDDEQKPAATASSTSSQGSSSSPSPATTQSEEQSYVSRITSLTDQLVSLLDPAYAALESGNIQDANSVQAKANSLYDQIEALKIPSSVKDIGDHYLSGAYELNSSINSMQAATVAMASGDADLLDYYANLAADAQTRATSEFSKATDLLNARNS